MEEKIENIVRALKPLIKLKEEDLYIFANLLLVACEKERLSYSELIEMAKDKAEDLLFSAFELRMLIPVNPMKPTLSWEDSCFMLNEMESYVMPNIAKFLIKIAMEKGELDIREAIRELFKDIKEENWRIMPDIVEGLVKSSDGKNINAHQIKEVLKRFGLEEKTGYFILILKGSGIISPHIRGLREVIKEGEESPLYEVNPLLFHGLSH